jgi:hypothetical protein
LIKKQVFDHIGEFETRWGSVGDFEWQMRAALVYNCVFIPDKLATWRIHASQATGKISQLEISLRMLQMAKSAFYKTKAIAPEVIKPFNIIDFLRFLELDVIEYQWRQTQMKPYSLFNFARRILALSPAFFDWMHLILNRKPWDLWDCEERLLRIEKVFSKYRVRKPVFFD